MTALLYDIGRFRLHEKPKSFVSARLLRDKVEEIPLRHERQKFAVRRQMREVGDHQHFARYLSAQFCHLLMWPLKKLFEQAQLVHQFERRRMYRVSAKITKEIA